MSKEEYLITLRLLIEETGAFELPVEYNPVYSLVGEKSNGKSRLDILIKNALAKSKEKEEKTDDEKIL